MLLFFPFITEEKMAHNWKSGGNKSSEFRDISLFKHIHMYAGRYLFLCTFENIGIYKHLNIYRCDIYIDVCVCMRRLVYKNIQK